MMTKFRFCSKSLLSLSKCCHRVSLSSNNATAAMLIRFSHQSSQQTTHNSLNKHKSNAEELISKVPVIEVPGHVAVCDGGSGALGHPIEYIQLDTVSKKPAICKYCGLRYKMSEGPHHHH